MMMESTPDGERKKPPEGTSGGGGGGESKSKRKMKTPMQLELLEKTYAVEAYPSEAIRQELSAKLDLSDRQLQMWFCHRRLKDRKVAPEKKPRKDNMQLTASTSGQGLDEMMMGGGDQGNDPGSGSGSGSGSSQYEHRKVGGSGGRSTVSRGIADTTVAMSRRYRETPQDISELRAIAFVESQLGEALREDGPILGMEFDPLPPGAFGAPIVAQQKQAGRPYDGKMYDRHDTKSIKTPSVLPGSSGSKRKLASGNAHMVHPQSAPRALQEYQFLPEQPSVRSDTYERADPSHFYSSQHDGHNVRASSLSAGGCHLHGKEQLPTGYGQGTSASLQSQQGRHSHVLGEYDRMDVQVGLENPLLLCDRRMSNEDEAARLERKRKFAQSDEARIAREVEAHEKRIRKELEKQDILRRKREEQMRREMEKHDRERRKEEERLMREKLREEERFQREQKRELERRERFMQKENLRAEKMRQKEEQRREKEAARQKAANERATARRIAKESMELIEDERLELMELAASSKGLPSIISLDSDTLENLDLFKDMLVTFPPKSVQLSRPFAIQPWKDSEENVGNLLMVWRFLITFADILELWPFTLDEFVQAFHDYDPRLLGEIHVALLRSIVKDIEDVARTPSMGLGANQNSSANPGGGHPQIVEGAYAWGYDIRSWQQHLNPLTWPEVLRQFALSAGFGPQLKKRSLEQSFFRDDNEGHDCEDIVSTLRNGAAAVSAAAVMQEKGLSQPRRSRHRLTPGTVKFAAFHVLSLEGSKGLSILEVADKIQKSGLRDLTTSKTPEASIAAALSRDSHLFERTAPSTYCVRAAFRKDPNDADAILSAAREKIQIFANGLSDSEEAGKDVEDADDDSECDVAEDPEVDDIDMTSNQKEGHHLASIVTDKSVACLKVGKRENAGNEVGEILQSGHGSAPGSSLSSFPLEGSQEIGNSGSLTGQSADLARNSNGASTNDLEDAEIDESNTGEPWVQGLMEGEYADLTVEDRLNALVALIGVAIEGNSVRVILEERLEAANALKKQMWAEAQLDKRRMKEEYITKPQSLSFMGTKTELNVMSSVVDGSQSPFGDSKNNEASLNPSLKEEPIFDPSNAQIYLNNMSAECNVTPENYQQQHAYAAAEKSRSQYKSYIGQRAEEMYVYRSLPLGQDRKRNRYWQFVTSATRNDPGTGRIFYESQGGCWRLIDTEEAFDILLSSLDIRGIRESHLHSMLQKIEVSFKDAVRRNSKCRNHVNPAEDRVKTEVTEIAQSPDRSAGTESPSSTVCAVGSDTVLQSSSFKIDLGRNETEKTDALKRYQDSQRWMWKECFNPSTMCAIKYGKKRCSELLVTCDFCLDSYFPKDNRCPVCHRIFGNLSNSSKSSDSVNQCEEKPRLESDWNIRGLETSLPLRIRLLKAQLAVTEVSVPPEAIQPLWTEDSRNSWGLKLQSSSSAEDLLQILTLLEGAIKRDCLSSSFETTKELLGNFAPPVRAADGFSSGSVPILPWVPQTTAAVALRLQELDASITYMLQQKAESQKDKESGDFIKLPSKYTVIKNIQEAEPAVTPEPAVFLQEENWFDMGSGRSTSGRGQMIRGKGRGRSAGGRLPRGSSGMRIDSGRVSAGKGEKMVAVQGLGRKSQTARGKGGRKRGKRTAKSRQKSSAAVKKKVVIKDMGGFGGQFGNSIVIPKQNNYRESPRSSGGEDEGGWEEETRRMHDVHVQMERDDISVEEASGESDDNGLGEYDVRRTDYSGMYNGKSVGLLESDAEDEDEDIDDLRIGDEEDEEDLEELEGDVYGEDDVDMEERYRLHGVGTNRNVEEIEEDDEDEDEENVDADEAMETDSSDYSE